jgi:hypothetical protein
MIVLAIVALGRAGTVYICDCATGADTDCVAGSDLGSGVLPESAWQSFEFGRLSWAEADPGDSVLFCSGGSFEVGSANRWIANGCTAAAPCTIGQYEPPWASGDEERPILYIGGDGSALRFDDAGDARHQEGVRVTGLYLQCAGCNDAGGRGIILASDVDDVTVEDVVIDGFDIGIALGSSAPCAKDDAACDARNTRVTVRGSTIRNSRSYGFIGSGDDLVLEDNVFANNGRDPTTDHNLVIDATQSPDSGIRVIGNRLSGSVPGEDETCTTTEIQILGVHTGMQVVGNSILEESAGSNCWGIAAAPDLTGRPEGFYTATIKNNVIRNVGDVGIGVSSCDLCVVENNVVVWDDADRNVQGIVAPVATREDDDQPIEALTVRNNTIVTASTGTGISVRDEGEGHVVVSNALLYTGTSPDWNCLDLNLPIGSYVAVDYDMCWFPDAAGEWNEGWGTVPDPLSAWSAASGLCAHCRTVDPALDPRSGAPIDLASAVIGAGHPTLSSPDDLFGRPRLDPDAGAYEGLAPVDTGDTGDTGDTAMAGDSDAPVDDEPSDDGCTCGARAPLSAWAGILAGLLAARRRR